MPAQLNKKYKGVRPMIEIKELKSIWIRSKISLGTIHFRRQHFLGLPPKKFAKFADV